MESLFNPDLDLVLERTVHLPPSALYRGWTEPELIVQWFTPAPWRTPEAEMDARPGGIFRTVMAGPDGERFEGTGCVLEAVPNERLVWTSSLGPGFRPLPPSESFVFTAIITFTPEGTGTRYRCHLLHADPEAKNQHDGMGFQEGWGKALDQLVELMRAQSSGT